MRYVLIVCVLIASGCHFVPGGRVVAGSGIIETEEFDINGDFESVEASRGIHVEIFQDNQRTIIVEGDDNIIDDVEVSREGSTLYVQFDEKLNLMPTKPVVVSITHDRLRELHVSGGSEAYVGPFRTKSLGVHSSGGSTVEIERLTAEVLDVHISGGGHMDIKGQVNEQHVDLSGGSHYRAFNVQTDDSDLNLSGGSWAKVSADDQLDVRASGGSQVWWRGDANVSSNTSGGSAVRRGRD